MVYWDHLPPVLVVRQRLATNIKQVKLSKQAQQ
jgi:hypothetical protein